MQTKFHRFTCPYCFNRPTLAEAKFICASEPRFCPPVIDEVYAKFWEKPNQLLPRVFVAAEGASAKAKQVSGFSKLKLAWTSLKNKGLATVSAYCPSCLEESTDMVCPVCHTKLPYLTGHYEELMLGIIGAKESGKSHYVAMLIELIRKQMTGDFNCTLSHANEVTPFRFRIDFHDHLFRNRRTIPATLPGAQGGAVKEPLIYYLSFSGKTSLTRTMEVVTRRRATADHDITKVATLEFFDTAGEDLDSEDTMRRENRYIFKSRGLVLLLDPLQLDPVREQLEGKVPLPGKNTENDEIVDRVMRLVRKANKLALNDKIKIPLAVAFSKCDAIESLISAGNVALRPSWSGGVFDLTDFSAVNREMERLIDYWAPGLVGKIKKNFKYYGFFAVSALGCAPNSDGNVPDLKPLRVLDPYLWLLAKNKVIRTIGTDDLGANQL
ncbi:MAG: hypothetical protein WAO00_13405 [Chthoniobacterales bacterium]